MLVSTTSLSGIIRASVFGACGFDNLINASAHVSQRVSFATWSKGL
jgi:hypothetical protein